MKILRLSVFVVVLLVPITLFAQDSKADDVAKENQRKLAVIVEQALTDTQNLRLPENRAFFYAQIGNLVWATDKERANSLFQNAAADLINAQNFAESKRASNPNNELLTSGQTRQQILNVIAAQNAELALDLMVKTRPAAVQRVLAMETRDNAKVSNYSGGNNYIAQNERSLEQNLYRMAADQNPDHAVKLLKDSLTKGFAYDTYNQLERLSQKDKAAATEMSSQIIDKLLHAGFTADGQPLYLNIQLTGQILSRAMSNAADNSSGVSFDPSRIRELANKLVSTSLSDQRISPYVGPSIVAIAEKFSPSSLEQIKKMIAAAGGNAPPSALDAAYQKLMQPDTPADQMIESANKFPLDRRREIYQSASNKLMGQGNTQAARDILADNFSDEAREQVLANFDNQIAYNLIGEGKFADAERIIDSLPQQQQRVSGLVNLANSAFGKDQAANKSYATSVLAKASRFTGEHPENSDEMNFLMQVIAGYSNIEPAEALRLVEGLVPKINELTDAVAVINGFQSNSNVRDGEFIMTHGDPFNNYGANSYMVGTLARADFDRTMKLIDGLSRQEMRISLRLQVAGNGGLGGSTIISLPLGGRGRNNMVLRSIDLRR